MYFVGLFLLCVHRVVILYFNIILFGLVSFLLGSLFFIVILVYCSFFSLAYSLLRTLIDFKLLFRANVLNIV